jgi:hypothetical protein
MLRKRDVALVAAVLVELALDNRGITLLPRHDGLVPSARNESILD